MTDTVDAPTNTDTQSFLDPNIRTPEMEMTEKGANVPPVAELALTDINPTNPHLFKEDRWQEVFARLRAEDPVHFNELETSGRYWSITKYDDVRAVDGDWETFSSAKGITLGIREAATGEIDVQAGPTPFIAMDPPTHTEQRKTVRSVSAPSNLRNIEPMIRERTAALLDSLPEGEVFDWVDTVSIELTTLMLATLFDFPMEDRRKLTRWSDIVFAVPGEGVVDSQQQKVDELMECVAYFSRLWEERRGGDGFDLVTMLANGEDTKHLSPMEQLGNLLLLIVGGNDTTRNTMSGSVHAMNLFPDQLEKLKADPEGVMPRFVPEVIRWVTPLSYMRRTATKDTVIGDKEIKQNDQVLMWYISANRDEDVFPDADVLDVDRENADRQLSFGYGIHFCMGSRVAELQLRVLWEEILKRFDKIEMVGEPERVFSSFVHGYATMPVKVTRL